MSNKPDDVFEKFDALVNKHTRVEPDFPVLTDVIEPPRIDLDAIPVLTEEIDLGATTDIELDLVPEPAPIDAILKHAQTQEVLAKLDVAEAELQAEVSARIQRSLNLPEVPASAPALGMMEVQQNAQYVPMPQTEPTVAEPTAAPAIASVPEPLLPETVAREVAHLLEAEISEMVAAALRQALAKEMPGMMHTHLDKALSSMLDQFMVNIEETVRSSVADEFTKQIAPFRRQPAPKP